MSNIWGLPQETQDTVRPDLNAEPELPPRELPAIPIEDLPELSLQDLPENLVNLSELASQVAFEAEEQLPLTQRLMEIEEPLPPNFPLSQILMSEGATWLCGSRPRQPSTSREHESTNLEEEEPTALRRRIRRQIVPRSAQQGVPPVAPPVVVPGVERPHHEAQRRRGLLGADQSLRNPPGYDPRHPSLPIYPPMPTRVPDRPGPSAENPTLPWFGDLIHGQSHVLHQILWRGRIADDGPVHLFEVTFEGDNFDGICSPNACACHPTYGGVGFHRWIYGQPRELPMDQRGAHVADMVQRTLRFLEIPDPFPGPPPQ